MVKVNKVIWDKWNEEHIARHNVAKEEVEQICRSNHKTYETYRNRVEIEGKTGTGRKIKIVLSSEDRNLLHYEDGHYYPITAYEEGVNRDAKK